MRPLSVTVTVCRYLSALADCFRNNLCAPQPTEELGPWIERRLAFLQHLQTTDLLDCRADAIKLPAANHSGPSDSAPVIRALG